jgi:hypothetical protein
MNPAQLPVLQACNEPARHDGFPMLLNLTPYTQPCQITPPSALAPPRPAGR